MISKFLPLVFSLTFATPALAHQTKQDKIVTCAELVLGLQNQLGIRGKAASLTQAKAEKEKTVEVIGEGTGMHGGKVTIIRRTGAQWGSYYKSVGYDPQGDPRWFIEMVGAESAAFFGYRMLGEDQMTIPSFKEFTTALSKINEDLQANGVDPVAIGFYDTGDNANVSVVKYTNAFMNYFGLPIAHSGNHQIHDLSFHTAAIFLPRHLVAHMAGRIEHYNAFFEYVRGQLRGANLAMKRTALRKYRRELSFYYTVDIDNGTGLLGPMLLNYIKRDRERAETGPEVFLSNSILHFVSNILSPRHDLEDGLKRALLPDSEMFPTRARNMELYRTYLPVNTLLSHLRGFHDSYRPKLHPEFNADRPYVMNYGGSKQKMDEAVCQEIAHRRMEIVASTRRIMGLVPIDFSKPNPPPVGGARKFLGTLRGWFGR